MGVKITDRRKRWDALVRQVNASKKIAVVVGVRGETKPRSGEGPSNVELAMIHEFGVTTENVTIPSRSFIRSTIDARLPFFRKRARALVGLVMEQRITLDQSLELLGLTVAKEIRKRIRAGIPPPNADITIARKGSSKPLIDTSQLIRAITHKVVSKGAVT